MALDARHRRSIYGKLVPLLGDDDTNALMTEFPSMEAEELVTKDFLRADFAIAKGELRAEISELQNRLTVRMSGMFAASTAILGLLISLN